jgi:Fic family protein
MNTLKQFSESPESIPARTGWYLADLGLAQGKQELFIRQAPQKLKVLREHALIESAISSNRIEGVTINQSRVATLVFGKPILHDRDEEEVRGYRDALRLIHEKATKLPVSEPTIGQLHRLSRGNIWDAGVYKEKDVDIIQRYPDGRQRVRFRTVTAADTPEHMVQLTALWQQGLRERWAHPLILLGALNLDFLCIHPFRDGNGRVSRLLLLLSGYHLGLEVGRYISLERIIEQSKDRYYETLEQSSDGWHQGQHDPWPYINYLLFTFKQAYTEFEERLGQIKSPRGSKTELVIRAIQRQPGAFRVSDVQRDCPNVSIDMIRRVMKELRKTGAVKCLGLGPAAQWQRTGK